MPPPLPLGHALRILRSSCKTPAADRWPTETGGSDPRAGIWEARRLDTTRSLSRVCHPGDWDDPALVALMEAIAPTGAATTRPHRKAWELALGVQSLERGGVLHEGAMGLSVGAGHEPVLYYLTNRCRWVFATDVYGSGNFAIHESSARMSMDPDVFAPYPYRRRRLTVAYMDALDLRFEDATFDFVVSFGSIEHFGGIEAAATSLAEMSRVLKPGGVAFVTTEIVIDGGDHESIPEAFIELFSPTTFRSLVEGVPGMRLMDGLDLSMPTPDPTIPVVDLATEIPRLESADQTYPHLQLRTPTPKGSTRRFTSVSMALVREGETA